MCVCVYRMEGDHRGKKVVRESLGIIAQEVAKPQIKLTWGRKFPLRTSTRPHNKPVCLGTSDMLPLLLYIKERDGFCISKQEVACASIKNLIAVRHLYLFGDLILEILDQKLK